MTIEQAVEKTISAGYLDEDIRGRKAKVKLTSGLFTIQAGNVGWRIYDKSTHDKRMQNRGMVEQWLWTGHSFIDHLVGGKGVDDFFAQFS